MKILQINAVGQTMSTGRTCKELQEYINQNTEHTCYTAFAQGVEDTHSVRIGLEIEWKLHGLLSRLTGKQAYFSHFGTRRLLKYMESLAPDVVILRNVHGNYLHLPMLLRYLAKHDIATVAVLHDCWYYTGKCTHYTVTGCDRWKTGCHDCPRLKLDNKSWFFDRTAMLWKEKKALFEAIPRLAVVGVSDWITNEARCSYLSCAKEVRRIYNWIDLDVFYPRTAQTALLDKYGLKDKRIVLGVASRWSHAKGLDTFCALAERLGKDYRVVLVGAMPPDVQLPASALSIPPTTSADALAELYSMANVFVTTSLEESFGKVSAEALACGTPVVCFDSTANRELIGEGCGRVIPLGGFDEMAKAVVEICDAGRGGYVDTCRSFAQAHFNKVDLIKEYIEICGDLLV